MAASQNGHLDMVQALLAAKAEVNAQRSKGCLSWCNPVAAWRFWIKRRFSPRHGSDAGWADGLIVNITPTG